MSANAVDVFLQRLGEIVLKIRYPLGHLVGPRVFPQPGVEQALNHGLGRLDGVSPEVHHRRQGRSRLGVRRYPRVDLLHLLSQRPKRLLPAVPGIRLSDRLDPVSGREFLQPRQLHRRQVTQLRVLADPAMDLQEHAGLRPETPPNSYLLGQLETQLLLGAEAETARYDRLGHTRVRGGCVARRFLEVAVAEVGEIVLAQCCSVQQEVQRVQKSGLPALVLPGQNRLGKDRNPGDVLKAAKALDGNGTDLHACLNSTTMEGTWMERRVRQPETRR
ncbi:hypothetical protein [Streptomyces asiaticus]